jgi:hypothetical protein
VFIDFMTTWIRALDLDHSIGFGANQSAQLPTAAAELHVAA